MQILPDPSNPNVKIFSEFLHFCPIFGHFWLFFCCRLYFCYQKCKIFWPEFGPNPYFFDPKVTREIFLLTRKKIKKPETRPEQNQKTRNPTRGEKNWPDPPLILHIYIRYLFITILLFILSACICFSWSFWHLFASNPVDSYRHASINSNYNYVHHLCHFFYVL